MFISAVKVSFNNMEKIFFSNIKLSPREMKNEDEFISSQV